GFAPLQPDPVLAETPGADPQTTTAQAPPKSQEQLAGVDAPPQAPPAPPEPPMGAAATSLRMQANVAINGGDLDLAAALLERALDVERNHAALLHDLAVVHYFAGNYPLAENFALLSIEHVGPHRIL